MIVAALLAVVSIAVIALCGDQVRHAFDDVTKVLTNATASSNNYSGTWNGEKTPEPTPGLPAEDVDPSSWDLSQQKAVATDLEKNGTSSKYYDKAVAAMDAGTEYTVTLTNGKELKYRIIGILHDDAADGSGKAGLTFMAWNAACGNSRMNATDTNVGGWEASELRGKMNSGEIWQLFPSDFQSKILPVAKLTNNVGGVDDSAVPTLTTDRLFLLSYSEIVPDSHWASNFPWSSSEGTQYEAFRGKVKNNYSGNSYLSLGSWWWERSCLTGSSNSFLCVSHRGGAQNYGNAASAQDILPAFSF